MTQKNNKYFSTVIIRNKLKFVKEKKKTQKGIGEVSNTYKKVSSKIYDNAAFE